MGATADGRPFVGEVPSKKGMWISAGFNGHGMVLCLKSAEALVKIMGGEKPDWFPASFLITEERLEKCSFSGRMDM
jgi:glycine/D-amino acid oxidase-like deaminating enzyme